MTIDSIVAQSQAAFLEAETEDSNIRAGWLDAIGEALESHREELVALAEQETHLPAPRLHAELTRSVFQLKLLAEEVRLGHYLDVTIDHENPEWGMGPRPDIRRMNVPLGVVGVFGASNFPFAFSVAGGDTASALAAGCSVVHKIHHGHIELGRLTAEIVEEALAAAGAPQGLFSSVTGREAGGELVEHPLVKAVGFTGSVPGGRALFDRAMSRPEPIPFYGELGSLNPAVITEDAWKARSASIIQGFAESLTMGLGQFCTKPGLLFLPTAVLEDAKRALAKELGAKELPGKMLNERISKGFQDSRDYVAGLPAVETVAAGDADDPPAPAVFAVSGRELAHDLTVLETEMFGPAAVVIDYKDQEELLKLISELPGQLTGTIHSENHESIGALIRSLGSRCGRLLLNGWPTGVTVSYAQTHGGPYPATTAAGSTSVGTAAINRFVRPVSFQSFDDAELPAALKEANPLGLSRRVNGVWSRG